MNGQAACAALERLWAAARLGLVCSGRGPESPALSTIDRDVATVRAALDSRRQKERRDIETEEGP